MTMTYIKKVFSIPAALNCKATEGAEPPNSALPTA
jgi:hypothetical protein